MDSLLQVYPPRFYLPLLIPVLFGILTIIIESLVGNSRETAGLALRFFSNICFSCFAVDIWAITIVLAGEPRAGASTRGDLGAMVIISLLSHMVFYFGCLLSRKRYEEEKHEKKLIVLSVPPFFGIFSLFLAYIQCVYVWRSYFYLVH